MRIVVVDPSRTVLKIVAQLLEAGNHEIHPFTDGLAALEHVKSDSNIDALITSVELGSMSGMDLCKKIRLLSANSRQSIYIVLMSANYETRKLIEALDNGADDFIGKPPAVEELYARLRAAERLGAIAARTGPVGDDRSFKRVVKSPGVFRASTRSLRLR